VAIKRGGGKKKKKNSADGQGGRFFGIDGRAYDDMTPIEDPGDVRGKKLLAPRKAMIKTRNGVENPGLGDGG